MPNSRNIDRVTHRSQFHNAAVAATWSLIECLEQRICLSSAIAAFQSQQTFGAAAGPQAVAVGDFNRDGKLDAVTANFNGSNISVLLGNGNGTFQAAQNFAAGSHPYSVAVADVNGDGKLDVLIANDASANVSVLLGNGNGTFLPQQMLAAGSGAHFIAVGDVNADGKLDVAVANNTAGTVSVLLGNGDGTFLPQLTFSAGSGTASVAIADLNGDGKLDLAVADSVAKSAGVLLGNGDGTFKVLTPNPLGVATPVWVSVADFNNDGKPDLVIADKLENQVSVLLSNGNGSFGLPASYPVNGRAFSVAAADVNGDGKIDLITANYSTNNLSVLLGNGNGTFQGQLTFATGTKPTAIAVADINGDGRADLLAPNYGAASVSELLGDVPPTVVSISRANPPGPLTSDSTVSFEATFSEPVTGVDATDFLPAAILVQATTPVIVTSVSASVYTVTVNGVAAFGISSDATLGLILVDDGSIKDIAGNALKIANSAHFPTTRTISTGAAPYSLASADVNGDGKPDIVTTNLYGSNLSILLGNGDGTFQPQQTVAAGTFPRNISAADINGDGRVDLVVACGGDYGTLNVLLGNGNGTFQPALPSPVAFTVGQPAIADVNGDGKPDVVIPVTSYDGHVIVLLGNGDGTFQAKRTFAAGNISKNVAIVDVNGDARPDLVVSNGAGNPGSQEVSVLLGNGDGTFAQQHTFTAPGTTALAVGDFDHDGNPDVVVTDNIGGTLSVLLGNGDGTFKPQQTFSAGLEPATVAVADVNGDGKADILAGNVTPRTISVLLGNGDGTFRPRQTFDVGSVRAISLTVADFNQDGQPDVATANFGSYPNAFGNTVSVLLSGGSTSFNGELYNIVPNQDVITGTSGTDLITLAQDPDHVHLDWMIGNNTLQTRIDDPAGLTINGNGGGDVITLDYTNGNPLPNKLTLNGTFNLNNLATTGNPLAGTTLDIARGTVFINYGSAAADAGSLALIKSYLTSGYNGGAWTGTSASGVIKSSIAATNFVSGGNTTTIGYADSSDGTGVNTVANTIELKYTLIGDANLNGATDTLDFQLLLQKFGGTGNWSQGNFNYDGSVDTVDFQAMLRTFGTSLGSQADMPAASTPSAHAQSVTTVSTSSEVADVDQPGTTPAAISAAVPTATGFNSDHAKAKHKKSRRR